MSDFIAFSKTSTGARISFGKNIIDIDSWQINNSSNAMGMVLRFDICEDQEEIYFHPSSEICQTLFSLKS